MIEAGVGDREIARRSRLIYRVHSGRRRDGDKRKGFIEVDYARLLDAAHQQLGRPIVLAWNNLDTHVSRAIRDLVVARDWLTVFQLPPYATDVTTECLRAEPGRVGLGAAETVAVNLVKRSIGQLTTLIKLAKAACVGSH
jgi:hypothetical protein